MATKISNLEEPLAAETQRENLCSDWKKSPFLFPGPISTANNLSIVHLKRDLQLPTILREHDEDDEGYTEGKVVNTRFGSFPHTTLIGVPWGTQIRASKVDTGSRGRRDQEHKRKREESEADAMKVRRFVEADGSANTPPETKAETEAVAASSGFVHLLPPTPENWTSSLPHRTQVVYTPDYSYILHRLRARPGTNIIEAGAGSGSFTHASARAVFQGYPKCPGDSEAGHGGNPVKRRKLGKVWSYEFHEQRHEKLQVEIRDHGLEGIVKISHRDVCEGGFLVDGKSPNAEAIFLDLPAPWLALPHLTRSLPGITDSSPGDVKKEETKPFISPLNPNSTVYLCTFSPCIEQVQRTISVMRQLGWVDIEMVQLSQQRFEIRRERIGIDNGAQRGLSTSPASVDEAVSRLMEVEGNFKAYHDGGNKVEIKTNKRDRRERNPNGRDKIMESLVERKLYKEGRLVCRTEPEVKVHTSYLVFAVLPMEWTEEDEMRVSEVWEGRVRLDVDGEDQEEGEMIGLSKRQIKKAERERMKERVAAKAVDATVDKAETYGGVETNTGKAGSDIKEDVDACSVSGN